MHPFLAERTSYFDYAPKQRRLHEMRTATTVINVDRLLG